MLKKCNVVKNTLHVPVRKNKYKIAINMHCKIYFWSDISKILGIHQSIPVILFRLRK